MPKTILLADDSVTIQKVVGISFAAEDIEVIAVDNGDDAIARAREIQPDVVLADVVMPGKNGYEVCEAIQADPAMAGIPVLLMSGTFEAFDEARAQQVGAAGHIAKPFEAQALVDEVRRLMDAPAAVPPPAPAVPLNPDSSADSFAFLDDGLGDAELSPPAPEPPLATTGTDSVFEFGGSDPIVDELMAGSASTPPPAEARSISVAPDPHSELEAVAVTDAEPISAPLDTMLEPELSPAARAELAGLSFDEAEPMSLDAGATGEDPFDFSFDGESAAVAAPADGTDPMVPVDARDLAEATILDPKGASGYDVSISDLGPAPEVELVAEPAPPEPGSDVPPPEETMLALDLQPDEPAPLEPEPIDAATFDSAPIDLEPEPLAPVDLADTEPVAPTLPPEPAPEPDPAMTVLAPEFQPEIPTAEDSASPQLTSPPPVEEILEKIEPQLRQQLHDTLEKIAWESFGDLTEAIVKRSVRQVETIAWEVIPAMAETLIREEIRRIKGEPPDEG
jgi:CheY-like chemotaxis protein